MDSTETSKKWYKKWWGITLLIFGGIWLVGLISEQGSTDSASTPTTTTYERQLPQVTTPEITSPPITAKPTTTTSKSAMQSVILAALYDAIPSMDIGRDDLVLKVLDAACGLITSTRGQDFKTVGDVVVNSGSAFNLDYSDAGTIIGAAVVLRCPQWTDLATEFANSGN